VLDQYRIAVVDFEMKTGPRMPERISEVGLVVASGSRLLHTMSMSRSRYRSFAADPAILSLRLMLHGTDYIAGYGPLELIVLSQLLPIRLLGRYLDILAIVRFSEPGLAGYSLKDASESMGFNHQRQHDALADAIAAWRCLRHFAAAIGRG
jgi:hypothetical protein